MTTINQAVKKRVKKKKTITKLFKTPQKRGICLKIFTKSPKKPNSALRKIAKIRLLNGKELYAYIPGEGYAVQEHNYVLIRNGKIQDLPGVNYEIIRGVLDALPVKFRKNSRSKYGCSKKFKHI